MNKTFAEWISVYNKDAKKKIRFLFELKNWSYEQYDKEGFVYKLKCRLCKNWGEQCNCFKG